MPQAILLRGLSVGYGEQHVLHGLDLECSVGSSTALMGPGGEGKTTLLRTLSGRDARTSDHWQEGELRVAGPCEFLGQKETLQGSVQDHLPEADRAVAELWREEPDALSTLGPELATPLEDLDHQIARLLSVTTLVQKLREQAPTGGILLLDEPDAGLDDRFFHWMSRFLTRLRHETTLVFVTRSLRFSRAVASHCVLLIGGRILETGPTEQFFSAPQHERTRYFVRMGG